MHMLLLGICLGVECLGQNVQNVCQLLEIIVPESGCMSLYSPQQSMRRIPVGPQSWQTLFCFNYSCFGGCVMVFHCGLVCIEVM